MVNKKWTQSELNFIKNNAKYYTISQLAKKFNVKQRDIHYRLCVFGVKPKNHGNLGKNNGMWKGSKVTCGGLHDYIRYHKPKPKLCEKCNIAPPYDLANISGNYKRDINDFEWLCRKCHMKSDGRLKQFYMNIHNKIVIQCSITGRFTKVKILRKYLTKIKENKYKCNLFNYIYTKNMAINICGNKKDCKECEATKERLDL